MAEGEAEFALHGAVVATITFRSLGGSCRDAVAMGCLRVVLVVVVSREAVLVSLPGCGCGGMDRLVSFSSA